MKLKLLIPIPLTPDSVTKVSVETPGSVINLTADPSEVDMCNVDVDVDDLDDIAVVAHSGDGCKKSLEFDYEVIEQDDSPADDLSDGPTNAFDEDPTADRVGDVPNNGPRDESDRDPDVDSTPEPNSYYPEDDS